MSNIHSLIKGIMKMSYIQSILSYFTSMDIANLRLHLKDEYTYEDTTKEIFLNEIEAIFEAHKNSGDTELLIYKGACAGKSCENCGSKGFRFLGNHSKNYMDLLFDIEGDDIKDISSCPVFDTDVEINDLGTQASFYFNPDDLASFIKTPEYWTKVNSALTAYNEIVTDPPKPVTFEDLSNWVDKHTDTDVLIGSHDVFDPKMKWSDFSEIYSAFKKIRNYISDYLDEIEYVNSFISQIVTEQELIDWILQNNALYDAAPFELQFSFENENDHFVLNMHQRIKLKGEQLIQTYKFVHFYSKNHNELLAKYNTYTANEESELYNNYKSGDDNIFSLQFHLEKRKAMEETGKHIPLYVNSGYEMK